MHELSFYVKIDLIKQLLYNLINNNNIPSIKFKKELIFMSKRTWNQYVVKQQNKSLVLNTIIEDFPISRAEIATHTGLNKGTVSSLVSELIDEELIYESGPGKSSGGRRPVILNFNNVAGYAIGIDLGVNYILGILTDLQGNICHEASLRFDNYSFDFVKEQLFQVIDTLVEKAPPSPYGIIGIGVGVPGIVNNDGKILLAPNLRWNNVDLKEVLKEKYQIPIIIENEANAGAYGEKKYGIGTEKNHIVYVSIGYGIGVGLFLDGKLYRGTNGFSGELGHMTIDLNGKECRCGSTGCWELYASEQALSMYASIMDINSNGDEKITLDYLIDQANSGDEQAIRLFKKVGNNIGIGLNNIVNIFNPEQIIIGGHMLSAKEWLGEALEKQMTQILSFLQNDLQLNYSKLSTHSSAVGVAAFSIEGFINNDIVHESL